MKNVSFIKRITIPKEWPQLKVWGGLDTIYNFILYVQESTYMYVEFWQNCICPKTLLKITNQIAPITIHKKIVLYKWNSNNHATASLSKYDLFTYGKQNI